MDRSLQRFLFQSTAWTAVCFVIEAICRFVLHLGYPYNYPAVPPSVIFGDFRFWTGQFVHFHTRSFFATPNPMLYPAPVDVFYKLFLLMPPGTRPLLSTVRFLFIILVTSWLLLMAFYRAIRRRGVSRRAAAVFLTALYLMSFPFWFELHQANMEFVVWVLGLGGIWSYWTKRYWVAAVFFGVAASMKLFPFVFVGLFLARKQYKQAMLFGCTSVSMTIASLWLVCPDVGYTWQQTSAGLERFREMYVLHLLPVESGFDHSLFCLVKRLFPQLPSPVSLSHVLTAYVIVVSVCGVALFFLRIRKLPLVNQILCLSIAAILLPPTSYDYTLLHLYAPFALLVFVVLVRPLALFGRTRRRGVGIAMALFAFLLAPQSEFIYHGVRIAGQLKAIALLCLFVIALIYRFPEKEEDEERVRSLNGSSYKSAQAVVLSTDTV